MGRPCLSSLCLVWEVANVRLNRQDVITHPLWGGGLNLGGETGVQDPVLPTGPGGCSRADGQAECGRDGRTEGPGRDWVGVRQPRAFQVMAGNIQTRSGQSAENWGGEGRATEQSPVGPRAGWARSLRPVSGRGLVQLRGCPAGQEGDGAERQGGSTLEPLRGKVGSRAGAWGTRGGPRKVYTQVVHRPEVACASQGAGSRGGAEL